MGFLDACGIIFLGIILFNILITIITIKTSVSISGEEKNYLLEPEKFEIAGKNKKI